MSRRRRVRHGEPAADITVAVPGGFVCACATARQAARALTQLYDSHLRGTGLEAPQFALLMVLARQGPCSQAALGRPYAIDKTTVSRNFKLLARRKWIESSPGADRRERLFALTAEGRRRLAAAKPRWRQAQDELRAQMSAADWDAMFQAFRSATAAATRLRAIRAATGEQ